MFKLLIQGLCHTRYYKDSLTTLNKVLDPRPSLNMLSSLLYSSLRYQDTPLTQEALTKWELNYDPAQIQTHAVKVRK